MSYQKKQSNSFAELIDVEKKLFFCLHSPIQKYETGPVRSMADVDLELALLQR